MNEVLLYIQILIVDVVFCMNINIYTRTYIYSVRIRLWIVIWKGLSYALKMKKCLFAICIAFFLLVWDKIYNVSMSVHNPYNMYFSWYNKTIV